MKHRIRPNVIIEALFRIRKTKVSSDEFNAKGKRASRTVVVIAIALVISAVPVLVVVFGGNNWPNYIGGGNVSSTNKILFNYPSISALKGNSTIVIEATVRNLNTTFCSNAHPGCLADEPDYRLNVQSYLKGSGPQTVYVVDCCDDPLLAVGKEYVLFLKNDWKCAPSPPAGPCGLPPTPLDDTFYPIGSAQGKFLVQNNLVYGYRALYPQQYSWINLDVNGVPLTQFEAEIRS